MNNSTKKPSYWQDEADKFASFYKDEGFSLKRFVSRFLDARTNILMSLVNCNKDDIILDLGCGSGVHMKIFAPMCKQITGIEISEQMLLLADEELKRVDMNNWHLRQANAQNLPFADKSFDWIVSMGVLDYVSSLREVLSECHRVLKDSGCIVFTIPKRPSLFFILRTSLGNFIKKKVFNLPPIDNIVSRKEINTLFHSTGFQLCYIKSIWTTMWMLKARKV